VFTLLDNPEFSKSDLNPAIPALSSRKNKKSPRHVKTTPLLDGNAKDVIENFNQVFFLNRYSKIESKYIL
jgi:hypothetical protein